MLTKPLSEGERDREMGCCPLGKFVPNPLRRRRGRKSYRGGKRRTYYSPPPPPPYSYRTSPPFGFLNDPVVVVPSDPLHASKNQTPLVITPSSQAEMVQPSRRSRVRFAPGPQPDQSEEEEEEEGLHPYPRGTGPVHFRLGYESSAGPNRSREVGCRCTRWEDGDRRREHSGGEFQYHPNPTPGRERVYYGIATDGNQITTIFSEENPNACSIT